MSFLLSLIQASNPFAKSFRWLHYIFALQAMAEGDNVWNCYLLYLVLLQKERHDSRK